MTLPKPCRDCGKKIDPRPSRYTFYCRKCIIKRQRTGAKKYYKNRIKNNDAYYILDRNLVKGGSKRK